MLQIVVVASPPRAGLSSASVPLRYLCGRKNWTDPSHLCVFLAKNNIIKILFLDHTAQMSGGELALLALAGGLDRARFQPAVLLFTDGPLASALREVGAAVEIPPLADSVRRAARVRGSGRGWEPGIRCWAGLRPRARRSARAVALAPPRPHGIPPQDHWAAQEAVLVARLITERPDPF